MKWKFPRWISTFRYCSTSLHRNLKVFNAAPTSRVMFKIRHAYGSCQRLQLFHVLLDCGELCHLPGMFQFFLQGYLIGISFFTKLDQLATKCCNSLVMWIPFTKAKPKEKQVKCFGNALFYVIKLRRLLGFVDDRIWNVASLLFNSSAFGAGNLIIVICVKENSVFNGLLKRH